MEGKGQKPMHNLYGYECCADYRWNQRRFMQKRRQRYGAGFRCALATHCSSMTRLCCALEANMCVSAWSPAGDSVWRIGEP